MSVIRNIALVGLLFCSFILIAGTPTPMVVNVNASGISGGESVRKDIGLASPMIAENQQLFFQSLNDLCGRAFEGYSTFPDDPEHAFAGKRLRADLVGCSTNEIRISFHVGTDTTRTWVITRATEGLTLKHDHRHADGTPDDITDYGGTTTSNGSAFSQSFPADTWTAELIPAAATNVWSIRLSEDRQRLTYSLERHSEPRFEAELLLTK